MNDENKKLPDGWKWVKLEDLCNIIIGRTPPRKSGEYWGGKNLWVTISDIEGTEVTETKETISDAGAVLCRNRMLKKGTLMFSFKLTIGRTAFAGRDLYTNEAIAGLVPITQSIDKHFLRYALATVDYEAHIGHAAKGKTLNKKTMSRLPIPLPPLDEQRCIAARMRVLEQTHTAALEQLDAIESLRRVLLRQEFRGVF